MVPVFDVLLNFLAVVWYAKNVVCYLFELHMGTGRDHLELRRYLTNPATVYSETKNAYRIVVSPPESSLLFHAVSITHTHSSATGCYTQDLINATSILVSRITLLLRRHDAHRSGHWRETSQESRPTRSGNTGMIPLLNRFGSTFERLNTRIPVNSEH